MHIDTNLLLNPFANGLLFLDGLFLPFTAGKKKGSIRLYKAYFFLVSFHNKPHW